MYIPIGRAITKTGMLESTNYSPRSTLVPFIMPQTFQFGPLHHLESTGAFVAVAFFVKVFI